MTSAPKSPRIWPHRRPRSVVRSSTRHELNMMRFTPLAFSTSRVRLSAISYGHAHARLSHARLSHARLSHARLSNDKLPRVNHPTPIPGYRETGESGGKVRHGASRRPRRCLSPKRSHAGGLPLPHSDSKQRSLAEGNRSHGGISGKLFFAGKCGRVRRSNGPDSRNSARPSGRERQEDLDQIAALLCVSCGAIPGRGK